MLESETSCASFMIQVKQHDQIDEVVQIVVLSLISCVGGFDCMVEEKSVMSGFV